MKTNSILIEQTSSDDFLIKLGLIIEEKIEKIQLTHSKRETKEEVLTISQTARFLGVSRTTIYNYEKLGILIPKRFGNSTRYLKTEIIKFLKTKKDEA